MFQSQGGPWLGYNSPFPADRGDRPPTLVRSKASAQGRMKNARGARVRSFFPLASGGD